jgi:hypothetical protein
MLDHEEDKRVKTRHDVTQFYQRHPSKRTMSKQELPRADLTIEDQPNTEREEESLDYDDVEDDTHMPSARARSHDKGLACASGSGAARDEEKIEEEEGGGNGNDGAEGDDDDDNEEVFDVEEINPTSYIHMGTPVFRLPLNPDWMEKISYKGKIDLVREKRKENPRLVEKEPDMAFQ